MFKLIEGEGPMFKVKKLFFHDRTATAALEKITNHSFNGFQLRDLQDTLKGLKMQRIAVGTEYSNILKKYLVLDASGRPQPVMEDGRAVPGKVQEKVENGMDLCNKECEVLFKQDCEIHAKKLKDDIVSLVTMSFVEKESLEPIILGADETPTLDLA